MIITQELLRASKYPDGSTKQALMTFKKGQIRNLTVGKRYTVIILEEGDAFDPAKIEVIRNKVEELKQAEEALEKIKRDMEGI